MPTSAVQRRENQTSGLTPGRWRDAVRTRLEEVGRQHAGHVAAFDLDNTLIGRDMGDETLAVVAAAGRLGGSPFATGLSPDFWIGSRRFRFEDDPIAYYDALQKISSNRGEMAAPPATAHLWAVQVMAGMTVAEVVAFAAEGWSEHGAAAGSPRATRGTSDEIEQPGVTRETRAYPFPHPEMTDLVGYLIRCGLRIVVISATNVWSTRWAVSRGINPLLRGTSSAGFGIRPEDVVGISLLLEDRKTGRLVRDSDLVVSDEEYAALDFDALDRYVLTPHVAFPIPTHAGKLDCLRALGSGPPVFAAGDSDNDLAMLAAARHRLWMARLEEDSLQEKVALGSTGQDGWLVQPVLTRGMPAFVPGLPAAEDASEAVQRSIDVWRTAGHLPGG